MTSALLLSGGIDSTCLAWWKRPDIAYTVDYGQLAAPAEIEAAAAVARELGISHRIIRVRGHAGSGDMAGTKPNPYAPASDWWPFRNQFLVTVVAMDAIVDGVDQIFVGAVCTDSAHKDGDAVFFDGLSRLMEYQEGGITIETPAIALDSTQLIRMCKIPRAILAWAHSCHRANFPCCSCRGCNKHHEVLRELESDVAAAR